MPSTEYPHFSAEETFAPPCLTRGFIEKNYSKCLHTQGFYEINIVLSGQAVHYIGKRKMTVCTGDTFIIPPLVPHSYDGGQGFDVYHLLLHPKFLEHHFSSLAALPAFPTLFRVDPLLREKAFAKLHFSLSEKEISDLRYTLDIIAASNNKNTSYQALISERMTLAVISSLCALYAEKTASIASVTEDPAFAESLSYIYESYNKTIKLEHLCKLAGMSRTAYLTKFKRVTGTTPATLQNEYRVQVAKRLLCETNAPVSEISATVGCFDTSHFVRIFKKQTGNTPTKWRKALP